jgi:hypothetical protein
MNADRLWVFPILFEFGSENAPEYGIGKKKGLSFDLTIASCKQNIIPGRDLPLSLSN